MTDKKISALPAATTPLAGTEVLPIVQSGVTDQVSVANLTAGRAVSATGYTATNGGFTSNTGGVHRSNSATESNSISNLFYAQNAAGTKAFNIQLSSTNVGSAWAYNGSAWIEGWTVTTSGDFKLPTNNLVVGTAGKGIADSSGDLKLAITTTSVAASSVLSGGLTHRLGTYSAGATTPSVTGVSHLDIANASPTTITNFTGAVRGQMLLLLFRDGNTTITRANAYLAGAVDFTSANRATLLLMSDGSFWYEVCRSTTNG